MRELRERTLFPSTVTLFGAKMSNSASEPIDLDVTDASTASKRPQWTLPPLSTRSIQPAVAFCRTRESIPLVGWPNSYLYDAANGLRPSLHPSYQL